MGFQIWIIGLVVALVSHQIILCRSHSDTARAGGHWQGINDGDFHMQYVFAGLVYGLIGAVLWMLFKLLL